jgi:hypothetical protein
VINLSFLDISLENNKTMSTIENFKNEQDYSNIIKTHSNAKRFTDKAFPPSNASIGSESFITKNDLKPRSSKDVKWERAKVGFKC